MSETEALVIELDGAASSPPVTLPPMSLALGAGELALIEAPDPTLAAVLADLCAGVAAPSAGQVRFLGRDWTELTDTTAATLRGRIGRVFGDGGWVPHLDVAANVVLPALHHTRLPEPVLRDRAAELALDFGLPGLPLSRPSQLPAADLARAACVRAFLGAPRLLLLESPLQQGLALEIARPLLDALLRARRRGAAAIWLTRTPQIWADPAIPARHRLRLSDRGLLRVMARAA